MAKKPPKSSLGGGQGQADSIERALWKGLRTPYPDAGVGPRDKKRKKKKTPKRLG